MWEAASGELYRNRGRVWELEVLEDLEEEEAWKPKQKLDGKLSRIALGGNSTSRQPSELSIATGAKQRRSMETSSTYWGA